MLWLLVARIYVRIHAFCGRYLKFHPPGLGFACRRISLEHVIEVKGRKYFFSRRAASMYGYLIAGRFPEPETHLFFERVFAALPAAETPLAFIDVGAAVGEMIMDVARYPNVTNVIGFEPDPDLVEACRLSACVNGFSNVEMRNKPLSDTAGPVRFDLRRGHGGSGSIAAADERSDTLLAGTLDEEFPAPPGCAIILIDVEGAELRVLQGGQRFIAQTRPMIIFEYNYVSRPIFALDDVRKQLGERYAIYRLRKDGRLDQDFSDTWNCVAIHRDSPFAPLASQWLA
jgi:FkbM family methyltransferase